MKYQKQAGGISGVLITLIVIAVLVAGIIGVGVVSFKSAWDYGNTMDNSLEAIKENNKNIYAQGTQAVLEIAQVPTMYANDLKEIVIGEIQGKFGKDGSKATMQWLQDRQINLSPDLYKDITIQIKTFRAKFEANQTLMIENKRSYKDAIGSLWMGFWLRMAGFPKINLNDFNAITTDRTEEVYKNGKEAAPLKLR